MPAEWMKFEDGLPSKREVLAIARATKLHPERVACKLMAVWAWARSNSTDGRVEDVCVSDIDLSAGHDGFGDAMKKAGWLVQTTTGIVFPNWDRHNSNGAKARAVDARVKQVQRSATRRTTIPSAVQDEALRRDGTECRYCGWDLSAKSPPYGEMQGVVLSFDHVIPVCQGGESTVENVVVACSKCNSEKNGRTPEQAGMVLKPSRFCPNPVGQNSDKTQDRNPTNPRLEQEQEQEQSKKKRETKEHSEASRAGPALAFVPSPSPELDRAKAGDQFSWASALPALPAGPEPPEPLLRRGVFPEQARALAAKGVTGPHLDAALEQCRGDPGVRKSPLAAALGILAKMCGIKLKRAQAGNVAPDLRAANEALLRRRDQIGARA